jgi:hydroxymethylpyrimidine/phosphomethylpyrimidine kinase
MDRGHAESVTQRLAVALTIAGSDSGGGAGIQADLKTFAALGVHCASVVTALTAQNTKGVRAIHYPPPAIIAAQIEAVLEDFAVAAIKIGMLGTAEIVGAVAGALHFPSPRARGEGWGEGQGARLASRSGPSSGPSGHLLPASRHLVPESSAPFIVYDPVMIASSGQTLSGAGFVDAVRRELLPLVDCLTPNLAEAAALLGEPLARSEADMARQGAALLKLGPRAALMKGGHLDGDESVDLLATAEGVRRYVAPRVASPNLHGTGCTLSSAIAANVVLGMALPEAAAAAKTFVGEAIERGRGVKLGMGDGPLIQAKLR